MAKDKSYFSVDLNCSVDEGIDHIEKTIDSILTPFFFSTHKIKGFTYKNNFYVWPNTLYSGMTDSLIIGKVVEDGSSVKMVGSIGLVFPLTLFRQSARTNIIMGLIMLAAWVSIAVSMVFEKYQLIDFAMPIFMVSCLYMNIQFAKYIQKPEMVDLKRNFMKITSSITTS